MQQQQGQFAVHKAPQMPLSPSRMPKGEIVADAAGHVRGIEVNSPGLIRSTVTAAAVAAGLLVVFYLPSEYGMDLTGLGGVLGLTEMGEIKQQLYAEDAADAASAAGALPAEIANRLAGIEAQLAALGAVYGVDFPTTLAPAPVPEIPATRIAVPDAAPVPASVAPAAVPAPAAAWRDEASYTLVPGEGIEVKLAMTEGQTAEFEWTAEGGVVNYDTHGDGGGQSVSYEQGRSVSDQAGTLTAAFTGNHGWFWRNRTEAPVTVTLRTRGDYAEMKRP